MVIDTIDTQLETYQDNHQLVVPKEKARIRVQLSSAHTKEHLDKAISAFIKVGKQLNVI